MPGLVDPIETSRKRKRTSGDTTLKKSEFKHAVKSAASTSVAKDSTATLIARLETQIAESQRNYNNLVELLTLSKKESKAVQINSPATLALCRIFCRLLVEGRLSKTSGASSSELKVLEWLKSRYNEYQRILLTLMQRPETSAQLHALTLGMQLVREEVINAGASADSVWRTAFFPKLLSVLLENQFTETACDDFVNKFAQPYDDIRHYTFGVLSETLNDADDLESGSHMRSNSFTILSAIAVIDNTSGSLEKMFCPIAEKKNRGVLSFSAHRKQAQKAWLALLNSGLEKQQRKTVLGYMTYHVVPWFQNVEVLMDFLTDSYNVGGATSLLSLSGLFFLMQEKNLDYPDFFKKLYSLLDSDLLHSKHRSRFFRLLNTFLSSTHLPAAMVASFAKRLSRLALEAPPAAIVAVIPLIYNLLKTHPTCTFMIHRVPRSDEERQQLEEEGLADCFDMSELDPVLTNAIDSCLWEIVTLQSHYHPNVASLAKIISEQFTKAHYNLEDFLDHSYNSLIEVEVGKELKKTPVVEFDIPKTIFTTSSGDRTLETLMNNVLEVE